VQDDRLIIRTAPHLQTGWEEALAIMAQEHEDILLDEVNTTDLDQIEWEW
jgi:antitoxin MazE